jgi:hypothetical protein
MSKLHPEVKSKWLNALRSGKYKQGCQRLRKADDRFCCLGVLCDVYQKEKKKNFWTRKPSQYDNSFAFKATVLDTYTDSYPPEKVVVWATGNKDNRFWDLVYMNDNGHSFTSIAKYIEENL